MDLSDTGPRASPRPKFLPCVQCGRRVKVRGAGPLPMYCSGSCKQAAFKLRQPKPEPKPKQPKVPLEERVAQRVLQLLIDRNVVTPVKPEGEQ
jgi:hypothetical protein